MRTTLGILSLLAVVIVAVVVVQVSTSQRVTVRRSFHANGRVASERPLDTAGRPHGILRDWDDSGTLRLERHSDHGQLIRRIEFDETGSMIRDSREGSDYLMPVSP